MKRSNAPIFWVLFGAGGMLSALIGAALVFITGIAVPTGTLLPKRLFEYERALAFAQHWVGKGILLVIITLFLWHAAHRLYHALHDLGVHAGTLSRLACYGTALAGTIAAAVALFSVGF
ncbi:MAG TPA: fumarate reductase subunit FrdD [Usitatibacteraceae bacterium]|nr:fumarate reductase subunit FrdD [Usitatibacteraceae bacterium]